MAQTPRAKMTHYPRDANFFASAAAAPGGGFENCSNFKAYGCAVLGRRGSGRDLGFQPPTNAHYLIREIGSKHCESIRIGSFFDNFVRMPKRRLISEIIWYSHFYFGRFSGDFGDKYDVIIRASNFTIFRFDSYARPQRQFYFFRFRMKPMAIVFGLLRFSRVASLILQTTF